jgi:hypothetical protein
LVVNERNLRPSSFTPAARHDPTLNATDPRADPQADAGQGELFTSWRYFAVFTDSPFILAQAEAQHRAATRSSQVNADLIDGPLAHLPSGRFGADSAWLACAAIAHNLLRAARNLAAPHYAKARAATIRREIIHVAVRLAHRARAIHLHLPERWPWQNAFTHLFVAAHAPPA